MWTNATDPCCVNLNPEDCGWKLIENTLQPTWFIGDPTPMTVEDILSEPNHNFEDFESNSSDENFLLDKIDSISEDEEEDGYDNNNDEKEENEKEDEEEDEEQEN
ncbi:acidic leucine-rich nuclear phosphoprotein 32 family member A-like [Chrysoperla carnea]|uniref:acidic leucine-rich nuclear phosphoprotein 32 family member A-like n=1 Tax=Chrysoperla carnea TaxID=189513 RepID=UPI001D085059|nr:acidic leucine-rich nuclear phosphoprotein 32 family member A-like [Chrysoperla carnea]XP_044733283.1 acidic leucine-rich nuclear phosphoprotein 32 family member A-like [Chrysoperla carnea]XP_044741916.1 acidic leucine-rich nuclear phosphoprotein 32 family member A-like [Chrysoperla carnea]XP_044741923.1 acidic leucine-rich nuclear phosphoprotein 32 family member A-like [Chrysoperla carnea]